MFTTLSKELLSEEDVNAENERSKRLKKSKNDPFTFAKTNSVAYSQDQLTHSSGVETLIQSKQHLSPNGKETPVVEQFNEAVIIDITSFEDKYILSFIDVFSKFSLSTTIEDINSDLVEHIQYFWTNTFGKPCTFICSTMNSLGLSALLGNIKDPEVPILCLEGGWIIEEVRTYNSKLIKKSFNIVDNSNCSLSHAVFWASSLMNTEGTSKMLAPSIAAFEMIPILSCVGGFKPPPFKTELQYQKVETEYLETLKSVAKEKCYFYEEKER